MTNILSPTWVTTWGPTVSLLFLLCVERLSSLLRQAAYDGRISGCKVSKGAPQVTHLLFADVQINKRLKWLNHS